MPIILKSEHGQRGTRMLWGGLYLVLALGAVTMVYPFLLMVSGSIKSRVDAHDLDIVPQFLHNAEMRFRKFEEAKYNENVQSYLSTTGDTTRNFRTITPPSALSMF